MSYRTKRTLIVAMPLLGAIAFGTDSAAQTSFPLGEDISHIEGQYIILGPLHPGRSGGSRDVMAVRNRIREAVLQARTPQFLIEFGRDDQAIHTEQRALRTDPDNRRAMGVRNGICTDYRFFPLNDPRFSFPPYWAWPDARPRSSADMLVSHHDATDCRSEYSAGHIALTGDVSRILDAARQALRTERDAWETEQRERPFRAATEMASAEAAIDDVVELLYGSDTRVVYYSCTNGANKWLFARVPRRDTEALWSEYVRTSYGADRASRCRRFLDFASAYEDAASADCRTRGTGCNYILDWHPDF